MSESTDEIGLRVDAYSRWLRETHAGGMARRTAETNAAFLLPHLRPGTSVLDAGCGAGTITLGLARLAAPGRVRGIDLDARSVAQAEALIQAEGVSNAAFSTASIYDTGLATASFDVVFCHAVLQHLTEPGLAVRELVRVLRPGGLIALVDADHGVSTLWPETAEMAESNALVESLRRSTGANPRIGRELGRLLSETGCIDVWHRTRGSEPLNTTSARLTGAWQAAYLRAPEFRERATREPGFDPARLDEMAAAWETWGETPGAFWARPWCEALARKPG